jgi:hypothetical protein
VLANSRDVFFANTIGQLFFPPEIQEWLRQFQTFGIFAAGYLARPLGGVLMAHAGDLRGGFPFCWAAPLVCCRCIFAVC